jgi:hypothetical protein
MGITVSKSRFFQQGVFLFFFIHWMENREGGGLVGWMDLEIPRLRYLEDLHT